VDTLIVRVRPGQTRIARVDGHNQLIDFAIYRDHGDVEVGDVIWARVKTVIPALDAAFVDIGTARDGFLARAEARPQAFQGGPARRDLIGDYVREGEALLVQVAAAARADKGAKLTARISVAGTFLVLTPNDPGVRLSKRIREDAERARLVDLVDGFFADGEGGGVVVRSAARGVAAAPLQTEWQLLRGRWSAWQNQTLTATPPVQISTSKSAPLRYLDEHGLAGVAKVVVDHARTGDDLGDVLQGVERHTHCGPGDVFETFGIADAVAALTDRCVVLPGGGSLIIEETAAVTTIDVNVGAAKSSRAAARDVALATNLEAVSAAARHMRLRNLAGLIVIDILTMSGKDGPGRVVVALKEALASDPAGAQVLGTTRGGLLEVTRTRRRPSLSSQMLGPCPTCHSGRAPTPLTVGLQALEQVLADVAANPGVIVALHAERAIVDALNSDGGAALAQMKITLGHALECRADPGFAPGQFQVVPISGGKQNGG